ncbi:MAG: DUF1684 domain-containing protein [Pseudonocardiales bacterium]|nr:DUF1684 domain-containing protein [Actinomycetota bacterium]
MQQTLELCDWRRQLAELYAHVRAERDPAEGHRIWCDGRDQLLREHPQSPLPPDSPLRGSGLRYWPYAADLRFTAPLEPAPAEERSVESSNDGVIRLRRVGRVRLDALDVSLDVWWLAQYAGGLFLPMRDGTAGSDTYGGGRYLLDTAKGADLGGGDGRIVVDLNFAYHPSCRYNSAWECPLAPDGNTTAIPVRAGERM